MSKISSFSKDELIEKLEGVIFPNPEKLNENGIPVYETADEYLSGNVRTKLAIAKQVAKQNPELYQSNVEALEKVQPEPIKASDISLRLGTTWIPTDVYRQFIFHLLETPSWKQKDIHVIYLAATEEWNVTRKSLDSGVRATKTFGTHRINAYKIIENTLNLRDVKIFDTKLDDEGKEIRVLNKKETAIAQDKQDIIKSRFIEWVWSDPDRRERLTKIYNEKFNSIRNRTYDGSHLSFTGMNTDIQ
ncbi:MAG: helicase, partial [Faecalibacillus sp.]